MSATLYPFVFEPILKDRIWGGTKLQSVLNKTIPTHTTGESWELSAVKGDVSVVKNGAYAGQSLTQLLEDFPEEILGKEVFQKFGKDFPLLFKFLDAREDLSIQVHPNDALAKERHNSFGKTEMWYVMQADEGAKLIVGFKEDSSKEEYVHHLENKTLLSILDQIPVKQGDIFFLETGTVHAIGAGTLIAEIQQTSDITYRLYDFDRRDVNGNLRELHVDLALDAINYKKVAAQKKYVTLDNQSSIAVDCPYFTTSVLPLDGEVKRNSNGNSFTVFMCTEGTFSIGLNDLKYDFKKGDTVLVAACITHFRLEGSANLLEITIS